MKVKLLVSLYSRGALSFDKALQLADVSHERFQEILADREIERHYTEEELVEDFKYGKIFFYPTKLLIRCIFYPTNPPLDV